MDNDQRKPEKDIIESFKPIADKKSRILILGTMPSPASLAAGMYYSHPQNSFWRILLNIFEDSPGLTPKEKTAFLLRHRIALWDTLRSCERKGALDADIKNYIPNDIRNLTEECPELAAVFLNGTAAYSFYLKFHAKLINRPYFKLPSTSPANCRYNFNSKLEAWSVIKNYCSK